MFIRLTVSVFSPEFLYEFRLIAVNEFILDPIGLI
jgi:hypothetical protein